MGFSPLPYFLSSLFFLAVILSPFVSERAGYITFEQAETLATILFGTILIFLVVHIKRGGTSYNQYGRKSNIRDNPIESLISIYVLSVLGVGLVVLGVAHHFEPSLPTLLDLIGVSKDLLTARRQ